MKAARMAADDALTACAFGRLGLKPDRPENCTGYRRSIEHILDSSENIRETVNEILNASCTLIRETTARDAGVVFTPFPVARYMCAQAIGSSLLGKLEDCLPAKPVSIDDLIDSGDRPTLERLKDELDHIRLMDTSCGTGIFLEAALEELCRLKSAIWRYGSGRSQRHGMSMPGTYCGTTFSVSTSKPIQLNPRGPGFFCEWQQPAWASTTSR